MLASRQRCALLVVLALTACDDEEEQPIDLGPTGPPSIVFVDPASDGRQPACVALGTAPGTDVPLLVQLTELVLRPPGACGVFAQCGHLELYVDDVLNNEAAVPAVELLVHKLADPYHDGEQHAGTGQPDVLRVRVDVVNDAGEVHLDHDGEELTDELAIVTREWCPGPRDPPR